MQIENMEYTVKNGVGFFQFSKWNNVSFVNHAFSAKAGGVSKDEFTSMNLSFGRGDSDENVRENYRIFCRAAEFPEQTLTASSQDHNTEIMRVSKQHAGVGIWKPKIWQSVDGLCTNDPDVTLVTYHADCVPLFFIDTKNKAIGLAHAGWRGTVNKIGEKMVNRMEKEFNTEVKNLLVGIGPSIGKCCYEVDLPVAEQFLSLENLPSDTFVFSKSNGKYMLDLWECNRQILLARGVLPQAITVGGVCTSCHSDLLFSHRVTKGHRGGMAAFMKISGEDK